MIWKCNQIRLFKKVLYCLLSYLCVLLYSSLFYNQTKFIFKIKISNNFFIKKSIDMDCDENEVLILSLTLSFSLSAKEKYEMFILRGVAQLVRL